MHSTTSLLCPVPVLDRAAGVQKLVDFPFLLPHEYMDHLVQRAGEDIKMFLVSATSGAHMSTAVEEWCAQFGFDKEVVLPIGLYGDGVPFKAKMRDSLEQFSWSFCCQPESFRCVFTAIPKSAVAGKPTWDALLQFFLLEYEM